MNSCSICDEIQKKNNEVYSKLKKSRFIYQDEDLILYPTVGSFIEGYVLLSSKEHYYSLYDCSDKIIKEIDKIIKPIKEYYKNNLHSDVIFFEHGTVDDSSLSSSSITHFHIHFLPVKERLWNKINNEYHFDYYVINSIMDIKNLIKENKIKSYILFNDIDDKCYVIDCSSKQYPSQFLRKVLYKYYYNLDDDCWNWRIYPYYDNMLRTIDLFKDFNLKK